MPPMTTHEDRDLLRIIIHGATAFELLRTAVDFDLFERIEVERGGMTLAMAARSLDVEELPARILLLGLASLNLLRKEDEKYLNTEVTREKLLRSSSKYLVPLIQMQAKVINPSILDFAESMKRNTNVGLRRLPGPGDTLYSHLTAHPDLQQVFYDNMGDASKKTFPFLLQQFDFGKLHHVVDVAGGDGSNAIALARRYPHLKVTVFDQETVCKIAARNAQKAGVSDRVNVQAGDIFKDPYPTGIDGVLFLHIFEIWTLERNTELLKKCHAALSPGGAALVYNFVSNDDNTGPLTPAFMSAYFLALASGEGMVYSAHDMEVSLKNALFQRTERFDSMPYHHALVVGYK
jgi:ubiquinone/menaquinone biosynthesis C-methylase UbiE